MPRWQYTFVTETRRTEPVNFQISEKSFRRITCFLLPYSHPKTFLIRFGLCPARELRSVRNCDLSHRVPHSHSQLNFAAQLHYLVIFMPRRHCRRNYLDPSPIFGRLASDLRRIHRESDATLRPTRARSPLLSLADPMPRYPGNQR